MDIHQAGQIVRIPLETSNGLPRKGPGHSIDHLQQSGPISGRSGKSFSDPVLRSSGCSPCPQTPQAHPYFHNTVGDPRKLLELGPQQKMLCFAWLVEEQLAPPKKQNKIERGTDSGEETRKNARAKTRRSFILDRH